MFILRLLIAAVIVSYVIWIFNTRIMKKDVALTSIMLWVLSATFLVYLMLTGVSFLVEGS